MQTEKAKITSKGQLTVPKRVRERLGVGPGDVLEFVEEEGVFILRKRVRKSPFDRFVGSLRHLEGRDPDEVVRDMRGHD
jgi:antitoxin PrlF